MPDIVNFIIICGLACLVVYLIHSVKAMRDELGIRQRVTALEEKIFGVVKVDEPITPIPSEKRSRVRKIKVQS